MPGTGGEQGETGSGETGSVRAGKPAREPAAPRTPTCYFRPAEEHSALYLPAQISEIV